MIDIAVNGRPVRALLHTGSTQTLVRPFLVGQPDKLKGGHVRVCCVNGDEHEYPTAEICVEVQDQTYRLKAGIVKGLSHSVVLGQDVGILPELVQSTQPVSMVATRAQTKRTLADESDTQSLLDVMPFSQEEISSPDRVREPKSCSQRRREKLFGTVKAMSRVDNQGVPSAGEDVWDVPGDLKELQQQDGSLKGLFEKATEVEGVSTGRAKALTGEYYFVREGLLYHQPEGDSTEQLVVPCTLRSRILSLGHDLPWSGHLGNVKTLQRIASRFYWPGLYTDVHKHCRTCPTCQLSSKQKVRPFPLQPLPIIEEPFTRIGMDIVGPLERTQTGHQYILVICDYATRKHFPYVRSYPEQLPLHCYSCSPE